MSYKALYRKYRPTKFEEVVGQEYIIKALKNSIKNNKIAHAYLFCGTRGTGKTTIAKIFAKSINCLDKDNVPCNNCENCISSDENNNPDIIEIDAASNNSVDNIREIIERVKYAPTMSKYKVYIIDEVHMLSKGAFNALLKTLEEPPSYVVFILATTEPYKVIPTIISRCQRYDFLRVDKNSIIKRIGIVADYENVKISDNAKELIAYLAEGGMRDALSILDQCISYSDDELTIENIKELYGLTSIKDKIELIKYIENKNSKKVLESIKELNLRGIDFKKITSEFINIFKESILYMYTKDKSILEIIDEEDIKIITSLYSINEMLSMIDILMKTIESYANAVDIYSYFEIACLKLMNVKEVVNNKDEFKPVIEKIEELVSNVSVIDIVEDNKYETNKQDIHTETLKNEEVKNLDDIKDIIENKDYDSEFILSLLVQCNKQDKALDIDKFEKISKYRYDIDNGKFASLLTNTSIIASGKDCILLLSTHDSIVNNINESSMNKGIYEFIVDKLNIDKMVYAINESLYKNTLNIYKERSMSKTLPEPFKIERYTKEEIVKKDEDFDKFLNLFGEENIEIIEE